MRRAHSWLSEVLVRDPVLRTLQRRLDQRIQQWEIRQTVAEFRREGKPCPVLATAERFRVSRFTVHRALRATR